MILINIHEDDVKDDDDSWWAAQRARSQVLLYGPRT